MAIVVPAATTEEALGLVSVDVYRRLTGDETTSESDIGQALTDALRLIEEELRRKLTLDSYTEELEVIGNAVFPGMTPVLEATGYTYRSNRLYFEYPLVFGEPYVSVTYVGGYDSETLPQTILLAIVNTARDLLNESVSIDSSVPAGATSISVGDVKVSYGSSGGSSTSTELSQGTRRSIRKWKRRFI